MKDRARSWARGSPPFVVEAIEALRVDRLVDRIDRVRNVQDRVAIRIPRSPRHLRRTSIQIYGQHGSDLAVEAMRSGGWLGFERPLPDVVVRTVRGAAGCFLDVGANSGLYALVAAGANRDVRVHAFEAFPPVVEVLRRNVALNACGARIEIVAKAVAEVCAELSLYVPRSIGALETSCSLDPNFKEDIDEEIRVPSVTLDSYWSEIGRPRVNAIKIDVEGAEHRVLSGAAEIVGNQRPIIFYEFLPRGAGDAIEAFASSHELLDVRLSALDAVVGDTVRFHPDAWNHALVPVERVKEFGATLASSGLAVNRI